MIITVKLKIKTMSDNIADFQRQYNNVYHWAYNRFMEGKTRSEVFTMLKDDRLSHVEKLDLTWKREAAKVAKGLADASLKTGNKVIFSSKAYKRRSRGKTTREQFLKEKEQGLTYIKCEGSKADPNGNRKFKFDIDTMIGSVKLDGRVVTFTCEKTNKANIKLMREAYAKAQRGLAGISYAIKPDYFYICVDLDDVEKQTYKQVYGRTLALDANPNYIGLSIVDSDDTIILRKVYSLVDLPKKQTNKHKYELTQIAIQIADLCRTYCVSLAGFEKLKIQSGDKKKGRRFNKQVNNEWRRDYFFNSLKKHLELIACPYREIVASYSSFVGCMCYPDETDSIAASIELNRRLRLIYRIYVEQSTPKREIVFPSWEACLTDRWKEKSDGFDGISGWKLFYDTMKKAGHSYRCLYPQWLRSSGYREHRLNRSDKSHVAVVTAHGNKKLCFN